MRATVILAVALVVISCGEKADNSVADKGEVPVQVVDDMLIVQSDNGRMQLRMESELMERYQNDSLEWEFFPKGFKAFAYDEEGRLETLLRADQARHTKPVGPDGNEIWAAFGNVVVRNLIQRETMETDTLYWDRATEKIYTDCYVRLYSPSGFMQGYGLEADQRGRNSVIMRPFNSYGLMESDSTVIEVDTVNFIGPMQKKQ